MRRVAEASLTAACNNLQSTLSREDETNLQLANFPDHVGANVESFAAELETALTRLIELRNGREHKRIDIVRQVVRHWFQVSYPFVRSFLSVGSAVQPLSLPLT